MAVTQKDIAQHVGVSRQAVAHTLAGRGRISAATRARILQAAGELGYRPNPVARALTTGRTQRLAFWFYPTLAPHARMIINHLDWQLSASPYNLVITNAYGYTKTPQVRASPHMFPPAEWPVDGVFAFEVPTIPDRVLESRGKSTTPMVYMGYDYQSFVPGDGIDAVLVDFRPAAEAAVRHLLQTRRRVAMLCLEPLVNGKDGRTQAYEAAVRAAGRAPEYIFPPYELPIRENARQKLLAYVQEHGCPDAIFCGNDEQATAVNLALAQLGRHVPADVAIIGCDGLEETKYQVPPLSTILQPVEEMCHIAWETLQRRMAEPDAPRQITVLQARFEPRESS